MTQQGWILPLLVLATAAALVAANRQVDRESLRSALDAVARKQRSLDQPEYYNDLHSFKYHGGDTERKFTDRALNDDDNDDDEGMEFLANDNGQLETVGDGLQGLNNRLLERALFDYLESLPEQEEEEPVASIFRERERGASRKRGGERFGGLDNRDLARILAEELRDGGLYGSPSDADEDDYQSILQTIRDQYGDGENRVYEIAGPMSWSEVFARGETANSHARNDENDFMDRDQSVLYLSPAERRNVNGRYPIGREYSGYREIMAKRYPVAKRSLRPVQAKLKSTDPKVAHELGALFGTQSTDPHNHTRKTDHDQSKVNVHGNSSGTTLKSPPMPDDGNENSTKPAKSKFVQVRKKSVDWSQYFGIDRRRKKADFMAGPGTRNQDDEWMLQRYYENMAENLNAKGDEKEHADKYERMDPKLRYIKDLILEEALRYANLEDERDLQKVKDKLMARMAAAYSLQKMRKALGDLRNSAAAQKEAHRARNATQDRRGDGHGEEAAAGNAEAVKRDEKRQNNVDEDVASEDGGSCPELEAIEWRCRTVDNLVGDTARMLYVPCVILQICKACTQDEEGLLPCLGAYAAEAGKICDALDSREESTPRIHREEMQTCASAALLLSQLQPSAAAALRCRVNARESCLRRYHQRYGHRRPASPYDGRRSQSSDR